MSNPATQELTEAEGQRAFKLHKELLGLAVSATEHFYRMGEIMKDIRDNELWQAMGAESFAAYYASPELAFKKSSVYHAIAIVDKFPKIADVSDIPVSKLILIGPHVTDDNRKEMVGMAQGLSYSDLVHQLVVKKMATAFPKLPEIPKIYPCNVCGRMKGITWDQMCHCGWTPRQIDLLGRAIDKVELGGDIDDKD